MGQERKVIGQILATKALEMRPQALQEWGTLVERARNVSPDKELLKKIKDFPLLRTREVLLALKLLLLHNQRMGITTGDLFEMGDECWSPIHRVSSHSPFLVAYVMEHLANKNLLPSELQKFIATTVAAIELYKPRVIYIRGYAFTSGIKEYSGAHLVLQLPELAFLLLFEKEHRWKEIFNL